MGLAGEQMCPLNPAAAGGEARCCLQGESAGKAQAGMLSPANSRPRCSVRARERKMLCSSAASSGEKHADGLAASDGPHQPQRAHPGCPHQLNQGWPGTVPVLTGIRDPKSHEPNPPRPRRHIQRARLLRRVVPTCQLQSHTQHWSQAKHRELARASLHKA